MPGKTPIEHLLARAKEENGKWLATATGGFYFLNGQNERDISIVDVAIGLARKCRYSGNIRNDRHHYSVAEHSDLMAKYFEAHPRPFIGDNKISLEDYLKVKLHDATEFVFPDVPTPIKDLFPVFRQVEGYHDEKIESAFIPNPSFARITKKGVKAMDIAIRVDERKALIASPAFEAGVKDGGIPALGVEIRCLDWRDAVWEFLEDFVRAVDTYPARDQENQMRANEHRAVAVKFLAETPRPMSREQLEAENAALKEEIRRLRGETEIEIPSM